MKIDWVRKLTSRKLWVAVAGLVTSLLLAFGLSEGSVAQVAAIIAAAADVVGYLLAEGLTDSASVSKQEKKE